MSSHIFTNFVLTSTAKVRKISKRHFMCFWAFVLIVLWIVHVNITHTDDKQETTVCHVNTPTHYSRVMSVRDYAIVFPDVQDTQIVAAQKYGVSPVANRDEAEQRKNELVYIGSNPYYDIDKGMNASIPYLVPRAANLLHTIGRNYLDSLAAKGVPLHKVIVSSVLRTEEDVAKLIRRNSNASDQSCHRYATTFDICYNRYATIAPPGESRRAISNDTLKWVLSEVLRDLRMQERCYIKYEVKQSCFHITTR